jgi:hypothetical protein
MASPRLRSVCRRRRTSDTLKTIARRRFAATGAPAFTLAFKTLRSSSAHVHRWPVSPSAADSHQLPLIFGQLFLFGLA